VYTTINNDKLWSNNSSNPFDYSNPIFFLVVYKLFFFILLAINQWIQFDSALLCAFQLYFEILLKYLIISWTEVWALHNLWKWEQNDIRLLMLSGNRLTNKFKVICQNNNKKDVESFVKIIITEMWELFFFLLNLFILWRMSKVT